MALFRLHVFVSSLFSCCILLGCSNVTPGDPIEAGPGNPPALEKMLKERKSIFGGDGLSLFGDKEESGGSGGIGVNAFLWRATLDTISFMPVNSADPFGGVIITDWHSSATAPNERFKLNIYIFRFVENV